jgi:hypothetical protein
MALSTKPFLDRKHNAVGATILSVRLAQEYPKYYEAFTRGDYKSVTAAAIAAGLIKDDVNLRRAKSGFRKMTVPECQEFLEWAQAELTERKLRVAKLEGNGK